MKVVFLHPPLYPVNYQFYNLLGKYVELVVYQLGHAPSDHPHWTSEKLNPLRKHFEIKVFGGEIDSLQNQLDVRFLKELKTDCPDIVMSIAFWLPSLYAVLLKNILKFKFIITTDAIEVTEKSNSFLRENLRKFISSKTDMFISSSKLTSEYLKKFTSDNKIALSIQTIDVTKWREDINKLSSKKALREKLKLDTTKNILLGVGNFYYKKNWLSAIRSMQNAENTILILIGNGEEKEEYQQYIDEYLLEEKIIIIGRKEGRELQEYFKVSDLFILPSILETFGFVVIEALATDLPVLCSEYAGASTLITNGYNGYIFDSKQDFSRDIQKAIGNLNPMKENAYESVKYLTLENRAKEFFAIFEKVLS